ncbi:hypothetical protein [Nonomuraea zeae]|uniref:Uncharacterized protein n=1 Tax=Nonomuraea zeae TaxID=1642303 RepID=A0A5S4FD68_9ACTN|nr:hypothetical protein [Nonomuraea zeae]TMR16173.1 hypothetical protein ETD85_55545 [Nonomuraea zeae]
MSGEQRKLELTGPQIVGSALAAVTAAVAASYLGVSGTVIGAALMSAGTTAGTAVYSHYLKRTGDKVKQHTVSARRGQVAAGESRGGTSTLVERPAAARRGRLPWARVSAVAALVFAVSMGSILAYQGVAGRTVADQIAGKPEKKAERERPLIRRDKQPEHLVRMPPTQPVATPSAKASPSPAGTPTVTTAPTGAPAATPAPASTATVSGSPSPEPSLSQPEVSAGASPPAAVPPPWADEPEESREDVAPADRHLTR